MKFKKLLPKKIRTLIHNYLGRYQNNQIAQLFVNDGKIKTEFAITNFVSFFAPDNCDDKAKFRITMLNESGKLIAEKIITLSKFGSKSIRPTEIFNCKLPQIGMFTAQAISPINFANKNKALGALNSHFYSFYKSTIDESMAIIHPQHFLTKHRYNKTNPYYWMSQYVVNTKNIERIEVYQLSVLEVWDMQSGTELLNAKNNEILAENSYFMKSKNIRKTVYNIKEIRDQIPYIKIGVKALCGDNAKPLMFIYSDDGCFTATHA